MIKFLFLTTLFLSACGYEETIKNGGKEESKDTRTSPPSKEATPPSSTPIPTPTQIPTTDRVLEPYGVDLNRILSKALGKDYQIKTPMKMVAKFDNPSVIARCIRYSTTKHHSKNSIEVSQEMMDTIDPSIKDRWMLIVLLHEYGHCDFVLPHNLEGVVRKDVGEEVYQGRNQRLGYRWPLLRKSIMWPSIATSEVPLLMSLIEDYARELVDPNYLPSSVLELMAFEPTKLVAMGYTFRYHVYSSGNNLVFAGFNQQDFQAQLNGGIALHGFQQLEDINPSEDLKFECEDH